MTEEKSCKTCGLSSFNNVDKKTCGARGVSGCVHHSKWQPISKPKVQMTEEEAMYFYRMAGDGHVEFIKKLKQAGYIRKSELVELVEEAEKIWAIYYSSDPEFIPSNLNCKLYQALQALKKDHPEFGFGGKK